MSQLQAFLDRCDAYAAKRGWRRSTLSTHLFNDGSRLEQIAAGKDVGVRRLERATADLTALESTGSASTAVSA